jgi:hypothetical protein
MSPDGMLFSTRVIRAFVVVLLFHVGLFWAPSARGWKGFIALALMLPALLIFGSLVGESVSKVARGFPLRVEFTALAFFGLAMHVWQMWRLGSRSLAFVRHGRGAAALPDGRS